MDPERLCSVRYGHIWNTLAQEMIVNVHKFVVIKL